MLTLFSIPKPFREHICTIQTNAIQSWALLCPACEIILFGDEEGTSETAARFGIRHIPEIECNEYGTPLINSIFDKAQEVANGRLLCYVNADILLMSDFLRAVEKVRKLSFLFFRRPFLMVGRRWDVEIDKDLDFKYGWEDRMRTKVTESGNLRSDWAIDYFVYERGLWGNIPPFGIGRPAWDNWMIYRARFMKAAVVDLSNLVTIVHQNHDYSHISGGEKEFLEGVEALKNKELAGSAFHYSFSLRDATWKLTRRFGLVPALQPKYLKRRYEVAPRLFRKHFQSLFGFANVKFNFKYYD